MSKPTMQSVVTKVLERELEHKRKALSSVLVQIEEDRDAIKVLELHRDEAIADIEVLEQALADLGLKS